MSRVYSSPESLSDAKDLNQQCLPQLKIIFTGCVLQVPDFQMWDEILPEDILIKVLSL